MAGDPENGDFAQAPGAPHDQGRSDDRPSALQVDQHLTVAATTQPAAATTGASPTSSPPEPARGGGASQQSSSSSSSSSSTSSSTVELTVNEIPQSLTEDTFSFLLVTDILIPQNIHVTCVSIGIWIAQMAIYIVVITNSVDVNGRASINDLNFPPNVDKPTRIAEVCKVAFDSSLPPLGLWLSKLPCTLTILIPLSL